jgi:uncharacterized repeat protein (TIGR01451 family)
LGTDTLTAGGVWSLIPHLRHSRFDGSNQQLDVHLWTSPNFNDPTNTPRTIDLVFTIVVNAKPFADGLFLTNEVRECEKNTFDVTFCQVAVAQVHVREPKLSIKKGVVRTDNPNGQFGVYNPSTGTFTPGPAPVPTPSMPPSSCPRVPLSNTNPINSANLGNFINSDLNSVDAGDWVTFAIAIENTGGAPAYNIELADIIPLDAVDKPSCFEPDFGGLCVTYGNGTPIPFTFTPPPVMAGSSSSLIPPLLWILGLQSLLPTE